MSLQGASPQAIQDHYDLSNDFYRLWLDPEMVYSCAMWEEGDTLASAQLRKTEYHIRMAEAAGKARVLDIGCGWGAVLKLLEASGVAASVGLTLSPAQAEHVRARGLKRAQVNLESWEDHAPSNPYDAIISVGAFEHFARLEHTEAQKTARYRGFFEKCHAMLVPGARLSLQTFAYGGARSRELAAQSPATQFLAREIFRETDPPRLVNIVEACEGLFEMVHLRNDRLDYARTCREWLARLKSQTTEAARIVGPEGVERYERYLNYSALGFYSGNLDLYRIVFRKIEHARTGAKT